MGGSSAVHFKYLGCYELLIELLDPCHHNTSCVKSFGYYLIAYNADENLVTSKMVMKLSV